MADSRDELLSIGRIRTSHGVRGYLRIESYSGETEHFRHLKRVRLRNGPRQATYNVQDVRASSGHLLLKLEGLDSPEEARGLNGWEIVVHRRNAAPLGEDEYYLNDLCGCDAVKEGRRLGKVFAVCEGGGGDMLEIEVPSGKRFLVPFHREFVGAVDVERRMIEIEADWLLR